MFIYVRRNYLSDILQMNSGTRRATGLSGLGSVETYQDLAARCAHQAVDSLRPLNDLAEKDSVFTGILPGVGIPFTHVVPMDSNGGACHDAHFEEISGPVHRVQTKCLARGLVRWPFWSAPVSERH